MLCDGRMVCGCADPYGKRVLGDARTATRRRRSGPASAHRALRADLNGGGSKFCGDCPLKLPLKKDEAPPQRDARRRRRCRRGSTSSARPPATSPAPRRAARRRPASPARARPACSTSISSRRVDRRGRPVARADRLLQLRRSVPAQARRRDVRVHQGAASRTSTSTRAPTASRSPRSRSRRLVHSGIDEVTFSIDGATPESYAKYRQRGDFDKAIANLRGDGRREARERAATCRSSTGATSCSRWNDSDEEMALARADGGRHRRRSPVLGAHRSPRERVLAAVRAGHAGARRASSTRSGTTTTSATPSRAPRRAREIDVRDAAARACRSSRRRGRPLTRAARASRNLSTRAFPAQASYGRRLVRLGAQLCAADGTLINRDYARAWLPHDARSRAARPTCRSTITAPGRAGPLRAEVRSGERRDRLVRACGSPTTTRTAARDVGDRRRAGAARSAAESRRQPVLRGRGESRPCHVRARVSSMRRRAPARSRRAIRRPPALRRAATRPAPRGSWPRTPCAARGRRGARRGAR